MSRRRKVAELGAKLGLALGAALAAYLLADLVAGAFLIRRQSPPTVADPVLHHRMVPNSHSRIAGPEFDYLQRINDLGLRGEDVETANADHTFLILMLGDSFTLGKGVADHQTFSVLLEESLNGRAASERTIQVVNAGVDSYAPLLSYMQLTRQLSDLRPDLVILNLDPSDLIQEGIYRRRARIGDEGEILAVRGPEPEAGELPSRWHRWIESNLYLTRWLLFQLERFRDEEPTIWNAVLRPHRQLLIHTLKWDRRDRSAEWERLFDSILRIREVADDRGADFVLTIYPWGHQVSDREWSRGRSLFLPPNAPAGDRSRQRIRVFAAGQDIPLADLFPAFRAYRGPERLYYDLDMHWTPAGHRLVAAELERFLTGQGLLAPAEARARG